MADSAVVPVSPADPLLENVWNLYRKNSKTLGFLPRGAMEEFAANGHVIGLQVGEALVGYAAWRLSRREAVLVHLCIDEAHRAAGHARSLISQMIEFCRDFVAIRLSCRIDYHDANRLWPQVGFVCEGERVGRGTDGAKLLLWRRTNREELPPLLALIDSKKDRLRSRVVIDANVFFDLTYHEDSSDESKGLLADWLDDIELCVTPEILNEISRRDDPTQRERSRRAYWQHGRVEGHPAELERVLEQIGEILPQPTNDSDHSDRRQLAHSILGKADYFATRDTDFLDHADDIRGVFGLTVTRPSDLIVHLDSQSRSETYAPVRMHGSRIEKKRASTEEALLPFQEFIRRESKADWLRLVRELRANPRMHAVELIGPRGKPTVAIGVSRQSEGVLDIRFVRALSSALTSTLIRCSIADVLQEAKNENRALVRLEGPVSSAVSEALTDLGFRSTPEGFRRYMLRGVVDRLEARDWIEKRLGLDALPEDESPASIETNFWPMKVLGGQINTYLVPIKPWWAEELFDRRLAEGRLIPVPVGPALSLENVYYSGSKIDIPAGSRILWYVSTEVKRQIQQVRAVSICLGTIKAPATVLARQFSRLGVYRWKDILKQAKDDSTRELRAYRFAYTELLDKPVPHAIMAEAILRHTGTRNPVAGPTKVPESLFEELYQRGMALES